MSSPPPSRAWPELLVMARVAATAVGLLGGSPAMAALPVVLTLVSPPPPPRAGPELLVMFRAAVAVLLLVLRATLERLVMAQAAVRWRSPPPRVSRLPVSVGLPCIDRVWVLASLLSK